MILFSKHLSRLGTLHLNSGYQHSVHVELDLLHPGLCSALTEAVPGSFSVPSPQCSLRPPLDACLPRPMPVRPMLVFPCAHGTRAKQGISTQGIPSGADDVVWASILPTKKAEAKPGFQQCPVPCVAARLLPPHQWDF